MLLGLDVRTAGDRTLRLLTHPALQAVNRDPLARQGERVNAEHGHEVWVKPLGDGASFAVVLFNRTDSASTASLN